LANTTKNTITTASAILEAAPRPKRDDEDRAQHHARDRIGDLDVDREHVRQQLIAPERDAAENAHHGANQESGAGFIDRHPDLLP
jgi:hypothetical protein